MPEDLKIQLRDAEREKLGKSIQEKISASRLAMRAMLDKVQGWNRLYESDLKAKSFPWKDCSNVNVPIIQPDVDTFHAHINDVIFGVKPITKISPPSFASDPAVKDVAQKVESAIYYVEDSMMNLREIGDQFNLTSLLTPAGVIKLPWREEYRTVKRKVQDVDPETGEPIETVQEDTEIKYKGPRPELIDLENFVIHPVTAKDAESAVLIGDRFRLTLDELNRRIETGQYEKAWTEELLESPGNQTTRSDNENEREQDDFAGLEPEDFEEFTFWEVITGYDENGDGLNEDCIFTIEESTGTIVRARRYPYYHGRRCYISCHPFIKGRRSFFKRCLPQILEHSQLEANAVHNQRVDATTMAMCKSFKGREGSIEDVDSIEIAPGMVTWLNDVNDLVELEINPIVPGVDIEQINRNNSERASGVTDIGMGKQSEGNKTLGELQMVSAKAGVRFSDVIRRCQEPYIEIARQVAGLMYQFMDDAEIAQFGINREDLIVPWQYIPHGNTGTADKQQEAERAAFLYKTLVGEQNPLVMQNPMRVHRITKDLLMAFDRNDTETYIGSEEEMQQMMDQMQQQQAMAEQQMQQQQQMAQQQAEQQGMAQQGQAQTQQQMEAAKMQMQAQEGQATRENQLQIAKLRSKSSGKTRSK